MTRTEPNATRRAFLAGSAATGALALSGCAGGFGGYGLVDAVRDLLLLSSDRAIARLTAPDGFWNSQVARIDLPELFGNRGGVIARILQSDTFRYQLQRKLNNFAEQGAYRAAPVITDAVRTIGIANAVDLIRGGPTAATSYLRQEMGAGLINALIPALGDVMRVSNDPLLGQAISALAGVNVGDVAVALANKADSAMWYEIGAAEADIRAHPEQTNNPKLIAALRVL
ncbi:MAG: DUF4197 domain-containing protein [Novosphingobium sp.]